MSMFTQITTEEQAKEFVEFVTKKFQSVETLRDWIQPISDELGVVSKAQITIFCHGNNKNQIKERCFLMLDLGEKKTILFVGNVYENWRDNCVYGTVDFSEEQNYAKTFFDLRAKNEQYMEHFKQTEKMYNEIHTIARFM